MNETVELVNVWAEFGKNHPGGSIEDFCRHLLLQRRECNRSASLQDLSCGHLVVNEHKEGNKQPASLAKANIEDILLGTIGRIAKLTTIFSADALKGTGVKRMEEAGLLLYVNALKNPKKCEAIYHNLVELSSGVDMLNRLIRRGLLREYADTQDRRSKRMEITAKGEKAVKKCKEQLKKMTKMLTQGMTADDMLLCFKLLKGIDTKFTPIALCPKSQGFEELYKQTMSGKSE